MHVFSRAERSNAAIFAVRSDRKPVEELFRMRRARKVARRSRGVGDSLRNNIDGQTGERNISIAEETAAYEGGAEDVFSLPFPSLFIVCLILIRVLFTSSCISGLQPCLCGAIL